MRQKILFLIISVLASIIVLSSLNEANAIHDTSGLTTLNDLKESSFFLKIEAVDEQGIGLNSICDQKNKKGELLVPEKRCIFEIESIRYVPDDPGIFGRNIFNHICIDTRDFDEVDDDGLENVLNCFVPAQGELGIGSGFSVGPSGNLEFIVGELANGGVEVGVEASIDVGFSVPLAKVETTLAQGDFRATTIGGNILLDSGIGSLLVHRHMALGHDDFNGKIEIFGKKPDSMTLEIGTVVKPFVGDPVFSCGPDDKAKCTDDEDFRDTLQHVCPRCSTPSSGSITTFDRVGILVEKPPISQEELDQLIFDRRDEIEDLVIEVVEAALTSTIPAAEGEIQPEGAGDLFFDFGEFISELLKVDISGIDTQIESEFLMLLGDLTDLVDRIIDDNDWGKDEHGNVVLDHEDLASEIKKIEDIIDALRIADTLKDIDDAQKSIINAATPLCISFDDLSIFASDITAEFCIDGDGNLSSNTITCTNQDIDPDPLEINCHRHCDNDTHFTRGDSDCAGCTLFCDDNF